MLSMRRMSSLLGEAITEYIVRTLLGELNRTHYSGNDFAYPWRVSEGKTQLTFTKGKDEVNKIRFNCLRPIYLD